MHKWNNHTCTLGKSGNRTIATEPLAGEITVWRVSLAAPDGTYKGVPFHLVITRAPPVHSSRTQGDMKGMTPLDVAEYWQRIGYPTHAPVACLLRNPTPQPKPAPQAVAPWQQPRGISPVAAAPWRTRSKRQAWRKPERQP